MKAATPRSPVPKVQDLYNPKPAARDDLTDVVIPRERGNRNHEIDRTDVEILRLLQDNARITYSEIGRRVHLSQPAVAERVRLMEDAGIITGYHAHVDSTRLGYPIFAFIHVEGRSPYETDQVVNAAKKMPEVLECHRITGRDGMVLKVITSSIARLNEIIKTVAEFSPPTTSIVLGTDIPRKSVEPRG